MVIYGTKFGALWWFRKLPPEGATLGQKPSTRGRWRRLVVWPNVFHYTTFISLYGFFLECRQRAQPELKGHSLTGHIISESVVGIFARCTSKGFILW